MTADIAAMVSRDANLALFNIARRREFDRERTPGNPDWDRFLQWIKAHPFVSLDADEKRTWIATDGWPGVFLFGRTVAFFGEHATEQIRMSPHSAILETKRGTSRLIVHYHRKKCDECGMVFFPERDSTRFCRHECNASWFAKNSVYVPKRMILDH